MPEIDADGIEYTTALLNRLEAQEQRLRLLEDTIDHAWLAHCGGRRGRHARGCKVCVALAEAEA